jgi:NAD-dependent deacetylase
MQTIVVFSGAGMSAESGIKTFRDGDGLWENHRIEDVATPEAWVRNKEMVLEFYNQRRRQVIQAEPNRGHELVAQLEKHFRVLVITQNIDDLHERAGSSDVLHLHGEIRLSRSCLDDEIYPVLGTELVLGDLCPKGGQLRPHVVWFGEEVPMMTTALQRAAEADVFLTIGSSFSVYPAAGLIHQSPIDSKQFLIDPNNQLDVPDRVSFINEKAEKGMEKFYELLNIPIAG